MLLAHQTAPASTLVIMAAYNVAYSVSVQAVAGARSLEHMGVLGGSNPLAGVAKGAFGPLREGVPAL